MTALQVLHVLEHDERLKGIAAAPQRATGQQLLVLSALLQPQHYQTSSLITYLIISS